MSDAPTGAARTAEDGRCGCDAALGLTCLHHTPMYSPADLELMKGEWLAHLASQGAEEVRALVDAYAASCRAFQVNTSESPLATIAEEEAWSSRRARIIERMNAAEAALLAAFAALRQQLDEALTVVEAQRQEAAHLGTGGRDRAPAGGTGGSGTGLCEGNGHPMTPTEPTAGRDWWAIEDAPDVSATLREEDLHCEARYLDEAIRQLQALADRVRALEAAADRFSPVMKKLRQARDIYSTGGIAGAASYLKQMFDWYDAALRSGAPRTNTEENHA